MQQTNHLTFWRLLLFIGGLNWCAIPVNADFVSVGGAEVAPNVAEIYVTETGVNVGLEIFIDDMAIFEDLLPDDWFKTPTKARPDLRARMASFAKAGISLRRKNGAELPVSTKLVEARLRVDRASPMAGKIDPLTGNRMPAPPEDERVVYVELHYDFEGDRPDSLTFFSPTFKEGVPLAAIGMIVFDRGVPVTDYRFLSSGIVLEIDWDDPWYTRFENLNLMRHHRYPMMTFIYAEPYEVRHEALLRVQDAAELVGMSLRGPSLSAGEIQNLNELLPTVLRDETPMTVDGEQVVPEFDRLQYLRIGARGLEYLEEGAEIMTAASLIGVIYSHPTNGLAKEATLKWTVFPDPITVVPGNAIDKAGPFLANLTVDDPILVWTNHFKKSPYPEITSVELPAQATSRGLNAALLVFGTLGFATVLLWVWKRSATTRRIAIWGAVFGAAALVAIPVFQNRRDADVVNLTELELVALSEALLNNVYRAFDFKLEEQVYDRLAMTLNGDILEQVFLDQRQGLRIEKAGGAAARVDALTVDAVRHVPSENGLLKVVADWTVSGRVGHWGHTHRRTNTYRAGITIVPRDGAWRIEAFDVLSKDRKL